MKLQKEQKQRGDETTKIVEKRHKNVTLCSMHLAEERQQGWPSDHIIILNETHYHYGFISALFLFFLQKGFTEKLFPLVSFIFSVL